MLGGGDWGQDRLVPDLARAALAGTRAVIRNPDSVRPWQHVLNPLSGYLLLVQRLWDEPELAEGWNFGPDEADVRPVRWVAERLRALWGDEVQWEEGGGLQPPEAGILKLDSSRARERLGWTPRWKLEQALVSLVDWYKAYQSGGDTREVVLSQIRAFETE